MPDLPITLPNGYILVYGWGNEQSSNGIIPTTTDLKFSNVYQVWGGGEVFVYGGDEVMWREGTETAKLTYDGNPYTMLPARLATKQTIVP